ncbi:transcription factor Tfb2 [Sanghuangporus baumii]|uniref:RNA polymerase II transcription factor B subunit 2 n=1 Tax=Sanghuangporus baumii TaxID=108892 RepID=A0A9Q5MYM8_SANBA|nr:transcription factor Tfb2 [Sanghuangporus baumii]
MIVDFSRLYESALSTLHRLHIIGNPSQKLSFNPTFKSSFRQAITGGGTHRSFGVPASDGEEKRSNVTLEMLDAYAVERWETILHYMVSSGTGQMPSKPSQGVLFLLQSSGLMSGQGAFMKITSLGFQFLLHSPHAQLWELLLQYLHMAEVWMHVNSCRREDLTVSKERQMDLIEVLGFLFMLSTMELGRGYSTENLGETQKAMMEDLRDYGLIWQKKASSRRFYPTRLATTLTSSLPPLPTSDATGASAQAQGFIILETNYRIYAYTDNPLQTAVLNLFVTLKYRFPNLVVGSLTRDSVRKALSNGITADQDPLIPVTVQDQIRLWELERNRLKSQEGYLYTSFASQADYELILKYAKQLGVVLWESPAKRCFFGSLEGHANIRGFIERRTASGTS